MMTNQQAIEEIESQVCDGCVCVCVECAFQMAKDALIIQEIKNSKGVINENLTCEC